MYVDLDCMQKQMSEEAYLCTRNPNVKGMWQSRWKPKGKVLQKLKATIQYALAFEHAFFSIIMDSRTERQRTLH